ncbi:glycoside hydrolase family 43 protein [Spirosoma gilvum]
MPTSFLRILLCLLLSVHCLAQSRNPSGVTTTYRNPVIAGDFADPSMIRVGDTYYAVGTSSEWGPAFPIYTSTDLVNWTYVGPVFQKLPDWTMGSYWAPELVNRQGTYYLYYTARRKSDKHSFIGVATTRDLRSGFTDHGLLLEWTSEAIDPFIIEEGGKPYITWKAYGLDKGKSIELLGAELSADGLKVIGQHFSLLTADRTGWEAGGMEGQAIFKRGKYYYMTYSGNSCCGPQCNYQVGLARAETLRGPWEKFSGNPVLVSDDTWKCPGHGTVVTTPDNRYVYLHHAYSGTDFTFTGRQGVLSELIWNDKTQWPAFRYGTTVPAQAEAFGGNVQQKAPALAVEFTDKNPSIPWTWDVSQPEPPTAIQAGQLQITNVASTPTGSFLGTVIKKGTYTFSAEVTPQANVLQSICLYGDAANALGFGIRNDSLELWQVKDGARHVLKTHRLSEKPSSITLQAHSHVGQFYEFSWKTGGEKPQRIAMEPINGSFLPRWDRAPRVGISVSGPQHTHSLIRSVSMTYP